MRLLITKTESRGLTRGEQGLLKPLNYQHLRHAGDKTGELQQSGKQREENHSNETQNAK